MAASSTCGSSEPDRLAGFRCCRRTRTGSTGTRTGVFNVRRESFVLGRHVAARTDIPGLLGASSAFSFRFAILIVRANPLKVMAIGRALRARASTDHARLAVAQISLALLITVSAFLDYQMLDITYWHRPTAWEQNLPWLSKQLIRTTEEKRLKLAIRSIRSPTSADRVGYLAIPVVAVALAGLGMWAGSSTARHDATGSRVATVAFPLAGFSWLTASALVGLAANSEGDLVANVSLPAAHSSWLVGMIIVLVIGIPALARPALRLARLNSRLVIIPYGIGMIVAASWGAYLFGEPTPVWLMATLIAGGAVWLSLTAIFIFLRE